MKNNQSQLQRFLTKQSLFKNRNSKNPTFLSHHMYVTHQQPVNLTQYKNKYKAQQSVVKWSHYGNKRQKKIEGLNINEIQNLQKSLNERLRISKGKQYQQNDHQYFGKRSQHQQKLSSPFQMQKYQNKNQNNKLVHMDIAELQQFQQQLLQTDYDPNTSRIRRQETVQSKNKTDQKITIQINRQRFKQQLKQQNIENSNKKESLNVQQSSNFEIQMDRTDSNMVDGSFSKLPQQNVYSQNNDNQQVEFKPQQIVIKDEQKSNISNKQSPQVYSQVISTTRDQLFNPNTTKRQVLNQNNFEHQDSFFNSTKRETSRYIDNIRIELLQSNSKLASTQKQIDVLLEQDLQISCKKMRDNLNQIIDSQLQVFKQTYKMKLINLKLVFIADLYEIKDNIRFRLQQLQKYRQILQTQHKWRNVVGQLLTSDYQTTIKFVVCKAQQIKQNAFRYTNNFLGQYNHKIYQQVYESLKTEISLTIQKLFSYFHSQKTKKNDRAFFSKKLGDNPKISDLSYK